MLQRQVEVVRNFKLLDVASTCDNSVERLAYVAAFSAASFGIIERRTRKPFDSQIGETYELETADFGLVGEQVDRDVGVVQVNGKSNDWSLVTNSSAKTCFHGLNISVDVTA
jgi:hypothetical protein